jgi:arginine/serine-rich splicing factor 4/5/6/transcription factor SPN1
VPGPRCSGSRTPRRSAPRSTCARTRPRRRARSRASAASRGSRPCPRAARRRRVDRRGRRPRRRTSSAAASQARSRPRAAAAVGPARQDDAQGVLARVVVTRRRRCAARRVGAASCGASGTPPARGHPALCGQARTAGRPPRTGRPRHRAVRVRSVLSVTRSARPSRCGRRRTSTTSAAPSSGPRRRTRSPARPTRQRRGGVRGRRAPDGADQPRAGVAEAETVGAPSSPSRSRAIAARFMRNPGGVVQTVSPRSVESVTTYVKGSCSGPSASGSSPAAVSVPTRSCTSRDDLGGAGDAELSRRPAGAACSMGAAGGRFRAPDSRTLGGSRCRSGQRGRRGRGGRQTRTWSRAVIGPARRRLPTARRDGEGAAPPAPVRRRSQEDVAADVAACAGLRTRRARLSARCRRSEQV